MVHIFRTKINPALALNSKTFYRFLPCGTNTRCLPVRCVTVLLSSETGQALGEGTWATCHSLRLEAGPL